MVMMNGNPITRTNGGGVNINICCSTNDNKFSVKTNLELTVLEFKTLLAGTGNGDLPPPEQQRLIYKGRILKDDQTLSSYGLEADHTVHMVPGLRPAKPTVSTPTNVMRASHSPAVALGDVPNSGGTGLGGGGAGAGTGIPLLPGLSLSASLAHGLFEAGFSEIEQVQQPLTQNSNAMRVRRSSPMQNIMHIPAIRRRMHMRHRQMRDDRNPGLGRLRNDPSIPRQSFDATRNHRNPGLGRLRNDPSIPRQSLGATRNPVLMLEMARNTGHALRNIESIGGAPPSPVAELGGLRLPDAGMLGPPLYSQSLLNRARRTRNLLSAQMASPNPRLRVMLDMNQLMETMHNPDVLRQLASTELMQQLMDLRLQLAQLIRQHSTTDRVGGTQTGQNLDNQVNNIRSEFAALVAGASRTNVTSNRNGPPAEQELYATQLLQMREFGFLCTEDNIRALRATSGDVNAAVERILTDAGL